MMTKHYSNSEEKFLNKVVLYGHSDTFLYTDEAHTDGNQVNAETLLNLCNKGLLLIKSDDVYYEPVSFTGDEEISVTVVTGTDSTATFKVFKSKEKA